VTVATVCLDDRAGPGQDCRRTGPCPCTPSRTPADDRRRARRCGTARRVRPRGAIEPVIREDIAQAKARGALNLGIGSRAIATRAAAHPHFISALTTLASGDLVPVPGGVLIRDTTGEIVGAVGVSGHLPDDDEDCAIQGIIASGLRPDPGE
jgi:uncharacterized protein GlcG (DUF336 family)